jgi:hypothetical protein
MPHYVTKLWGKITVTDIAPITVTVIFLGALGRSVLFLNLHD